jgi:hypothetical protein
LTEFRRPIFNYIKSAAAVSKKVVEQEAIGLDFVRLVTNEPHLMLLDKLFVEVIAHVSFVQHLFTEEKGFAYLSRLWELERSVAFRTTESQGERGTQIHGGNLHDKSGVQRIVQVLCVFDKVRYRVGVDQLLCVLDMG